MIRSREIFLKPFISKDNIRFHSCKKVVEHQNYWFKNITIIIKKTHHLNEIVILQIIFHPIIFQNMIKEMEQYLCI